MLKANSGDENEVDNSNDDEMSQREGGEEENK